MTRSERNLLPNGKNTCGGISLCLQEYLSGTMEMRVFFWQYRYPLYLLQRVYRYIFMQKGLEEQEKQQ